MATTDQQPAEQRTSSVGLPSQHRPRRRAPANVVVLMTLSGIVFALAAWMVLRDDGVAYMAATAGHELRAGSTVTAADLEWTEVGVDADVADQLVLRRDLSSLGQQVAATRIGKGELLSRSDVRSPSAPDEQRAMSLPIDRTQAVNGQLAAGDRVDVIEVVDDQVRYLATDLQVLSVGGGTSGLTDGPSDWTATVAVDADTALVLARALETSAVHLTRSTGATDVDPGQRPNPSRSSQRADADS